MPRRNKKSTAKKPKGTSGISINIKNIMRQVQNERPPQDFINLTGKKPMDGTNTGYMTRLQVPAMTYASRPLSQFPSLASISNIDRGFAPPLSQLTSNSRPVLGGGAPIVTPARERLNDVLETYRPPEVAIGPNPVVPTPAARGYNPRVYDIPSPLTIGPSFLSQSLFGTNIEDLEDDALDESQRIVSNQVPKSDISTPLSSARSTPSIHPWAEAGNPYHPSVRYSKATAAASYNPNVPKVPASSIPKPASMRVFGEFGKPYLSAGKLPSGRRYELED